MESGFLDLIRSDMDSVDRKVQETFKLRPGHLGKFGHIETNSLQKYLHPALVLLAGRIFRYTEKKLVHLASVFQLIYLASSVQFRIPDDNEQDVEGMDPRDGARFPVLVGDYLYGKYFVGLCEGEILEFLDPLADIIAEMNYGALIRKKNAGQTVNDLELAMTIIEKETALLTEGATKFAGMLAQASKHDIDALAEFGRNFGMAYGILERNLGPALADPYFEKATRAIDKLPQNDARDSLLSLLTKIRSGELSVPARKIGRSYDVGQRFDEQAHFHEQYNDNEEYVQSIFSAIARKYDAINTVLSLNQDKYWRKFAVQQTRIKPGGYALDVCCGTGMMTVELARKVGVGGRVVGIDLNGEMLNIARKNLKESRFEENIEYIQGNAMELPFADNTFDCATIGFGLHDISEIKKVLKEMTRVVKPGGPVVCLDFSKPNVPVFKQIYNFYFDKCVPLLGRLGAGAAKPYRYLHTSWKAFPSQKELREVFNHQGLENTAYYELTGGVVSVHVGFKPVGSPVLSVAATKE